MLLSTRSGGHSNEAFSLCSGVVTDQSCRTAMSVDPGSQTLRADPGVTNGLAALGLAEHGLALPAGTCESVCLSGLALGGGIGFLQRGLGLTQDSLTAVRIAVVDSAAEPDAGPRVRVISARRSGPHSDLFWALLGAGGGNFGIVTSLTFRVYRVPRVVVYDLRFSPGTERDVRLWQRWARGLPDRMTAELNVLSLASAAAAATRTELVFTGESMGTLEDARRLLAPMLKLGPASVTVRCVPYVDAVRHYNGPKVRPTYRRDHSLFLPDRGLGRAGVATLLRLIREAPVGSKFEVETMGGRINALANDATAFPHRHGTGFWVLVNTSWSNAEEGTARLQWALGAFRALWPHGNGGAYVNMADLALGADYLRAYYGANIPRLVRTKRRYDPRNVFQFQQGIPLRFAGGEEIGEAPAACACW